MWIEIESYEHSLGLLDKYVHYILDVTLCGNNDVMLRSEWDWVKKGVKIAVFIQESSFSYTTIGLINVVYALNQKGLDEKFCCPANIQTFLAKRGSYGVYDPSAARARRVPSFNPEAFLFLFCRWSNG